MGHRIPNVIPPSCAGLDLAATARVLIKTGGNVMAAARKLRVPPHDLRLMTLSIPRLIEAALEAEEQALDEAEATLRAALKSPDMSKRLAAAAYILKTSPAAARRANMLEKDPSKKE